VAICHVSTSNFFILVAITPFLYAQFLLIYSQKLSIRKKVLYLHFPAKSISTDLDGKYELTVKDADAILVFSYTGFSTSEVPVNGQSLIDITLDEDVANLDEIIVVGYGTQKKKVVTAAISKVDSKDIEDMPVLRIEDALQGRTSGVRVTSGSGQPGDGGTVRIRGTATLGKSDPLFIVDGVIVGGGIEYLNQAPK